MNEAFFFAIEYDDDDFFLLLFARREEVVKDVRYDVNDVNDDDDEKKLLLLLPPPSMRVCREREGDESDKKSEAWGKKEKKIHKIGRRQKSAEPIKQSIIYRKSSS